MRIGNRYTQIIGYTLLTIMAIVILAACNSSENSEAAEIQGEPAVVGTQNALSTIVAQRDTNNLTPPSTTTFNRSLQASPSPTLTSTVIATDTSETTENSDVSPTPTEESSDENDESLTTPMPAMIRGDHFWLARPFSTANGISDTVEPAYPYGTRALGLQPHHGVDIPNPFGTRVRAAGSGIVFYAGDDLTDPIFGPQQNFYGNVIVIEHQLQIPDSESTLTIYTLYGHLSQIYVTEGQRVDQFEEIGEVGQEGVAIGPHLHLEVRMDDPFDYTATYNPNLWLQPWRGYGVLAGRVMLEGGDLLDNVEIEVESLDTGRIYSTFTYYYDDLNSDPWFLENFVIPDLVEGDYQVRVKYQGRIAASSTIRIQQEQTTMVHLRIE